MINELKPCPRCGNKETEIYWRRDGRFGSSIVCYECKYQTEYFETKEEAMKAWNNFNRTNKC